MRATGYLNKAFPEQRAPNVADVVAGLQSHSFMKAHGRIVSGVFMSKNEPHQPHTLGAPSSQEEPIKGVAPKEFPCPECGKTFKTKSEMERHRDTVHHETKGHNL